VGLPLHTDAQQDLPLSLLTRDGFTHLQLTSANEAMSPTSPTSP
jgi:hypothetical protein